MTTIRRLEDAELGVLAPLFAATFGAPISLDALRWKYAVGQGESWTAWDDDKLVLHCGVCFRDVRIAGRPARAMQLIDLMAPPKSVGLGRATSPFALLMRRILQASPHPEDPARIAFGFPGDRAMRLGERLGVYRSVGRFATLAFSPRAGAASTRTRVLAHLNGRERARVDALWSRMAADFGAAAIGVRDAAYLVRRYLARPEKRYLLLMIESRWLGRPLGLAAIRPDRPHAELLDVVGPRGCLPEVFAATRRWLAETGRESLSFLLSEPHATALAALADDCRETEFRVMANPFLRPDVLRQLENRWWLTGGDTDYR